jgi:hypothetical protein
MENCLINTTEYNGQYVALESESNNTVRGAGATPEEAWNQAKSKGCTSPVLLFVEETDSVQIY